MTSALRDWIESRPGPFVSRTAEAAWRLAWANFNEGPTGNLNNEMMFRHTLMTTGYGTRALALGGHALDRVT
jgi:hypothetical protein